MLCISLDSLESVVGLVIFWSGMAVRSVVNSLVLNDHGSMLTMDRPLSIELH